MGVVTIHSYPLPEGKSVQQTADNLHKILEKLGAVRVGTFCVDCETFYSTPNVGPPPPRSLNVFHDSDHPASCFSLLDTGTCLVSDTNFDGLLTSISSFYQSKKSTKIESKGPKYQLGDFSVKVGLVSIGASFRGILIEVEYGPCVVAAQCWDLMKEFMAGFMSPSRDPHPHLQGRMNELFTPVDTIHQYNEYFNSLKKGPGSLGLSSNQSFHSTQNQHQNVNQHQAAVVK